jgi:hypothetical protein
MQQHPLPYFACTQAKVYGCFNLLGFGSFGYLPPMDAVVLTLVEK